MPIIFIQPLMHNHLLNIMEFFYMSRAFDKVCKLNKSKCIFDALLDLIVSFFLENCFQMVRHLSGYQLKQVFYKDPLYMDSFFWSMLISHQLISYPTAYELNPDLQNTAQWAHQWMSFNPDLNKQIRINRRRKLFFKKND